MSLLTIACPQFGVLTLREAPAAAVQHNLKVKDFDALQMRRLALLLVCA